MLGFLKDSNKWVKIAAYKNLIPFIDTLSDTEINQELFEQFIKMTDVALDDMCNDNEVIFSLFKYENQYDQS